MADTTRDSGDRYTVTARKYRPQTFDDLVAQEHVAETFRNAITRDRLAHVYLLCGPRGVGKTTAARLIAKAVNCQTPLEERDRAEPCRDCESCQAFEQGRSLNVFEIDAASNNGVDYMRDLRDKALVPPQGAKKKVYILDEVHMLSASAFNALLKLLEEPPSYVMFIFATTEPHKVLPTILSRSQRFDFRRISVPEIVDRLKEISAAEGITADEESLVLLARKGDGALRDALSVYDQAVSVCGNVLEIGALRQALGVVDADVYFAITDRAREGNRAGLLSLVDGVVRAGHDLDELVQGLAEHLRDLLVARSTGKGDLIEGTLATKERYLDASSAYGEADLLHLLMLSERAAQDLRDSRQPRLTLELALLKMASLESAADLSRLLDRLSALEAAAKAGELPTNTAPITPTPAAPPSRTNTATESSTPATSRPTTRTSEPATAYTPAASTSKPNAAAEPEPTSGPQTTAPLPTGESGEGSSILQASPATSRPALTLDPDSYSRTQPAPPVLEAVPQPSAPAQPDPSRSTAEPTSRSASPTPPVAVAPPAEPSSRPTPTSDPSRPVLEDGRPGPPPFDEPPPHTDEDGGMFASDWDDDPSPPPGPPPAAQKPAPTPRPTRTGANLFGAPALRRPTSGDGSSAALEAPDSDLGGDGHVGTDPLSSALDAVTEVWPRFIEAVRERVGVRVGAIVKSGAPFRVLRGAVEVGMEDQFGVRVTTDNQDALYEVLTELLPDAPPIRWVAAPQEVTETSAPTDPFEELKKMRQDHPVIKALFEQFGAEIVYQ